MLPDARSLIRPGALLSWPAERYPDKVAITYEDTHLTFRQFNERINRLANGLLAMGRQRGECVAALLYNSPRAVEVRFALMKAGLCMVALNVRQAPEEHAHILAHSQSVGLILDADYLPIWEQMRAHCPSIRQVLVAGTDTTPYLDYEQVIAASSAAEPQVMVALSDLERLAYTSGTTGQPKGIMKTVGNDLAQLRNDFLNEDCPTTAADVMLNVAPLTHAARNQLRKYYVKGARNIILRHFQEEAVLATIEQQRVTAMMLVPTMIIRLVLHPRVQTFDLSSLRRIFFGTAPMPADMLARAIEVFGNIFRQHYGLSEATQPVLTIGPQDLVDASGALRRQRLASAGTPALGVEVRLVNETGQEAATAELGEILLRGDTIMPGYWQDSEATSAVLDAEGWLHTGDLAYKDADGYVYIVDRKKDMIISGGFNIYPREVERVIEGHPGVQEVTVIGVPDPLWGEVVKAVIVPRPGQHLTADDIIARCKAHLASYKKPASIDFVSELPKNFQGKVLKRQLRDGYQKKM
jgi:acyl-CoA synthetase (AMP-forming)/AMP-acid ligase II